MPKNMIGLLPGVITTSPGSTRTFRVVSTCSATASRASIIPAAGV